MRETSMLVLRHASAGEPLATPSLDRERPLDAEGRLQARRLPHALSGRRVGRIVTSPHRRCVDTVRPLARALGIELECRDALAPDASGESSLALLAELPADSLVCTHREVIERLFGGDLQCEKGGAWVLERVDDHWRPATYLYPPSAAKSRRRRAALV
jgi:8-oxo-dGTP diphosphatase